MSRRDTVRAIKFVDTDGVEEQWSLGPAEDGPEDEMRMAELLANGSALECCTKGPCVFGEIAAWFLITQMPAVNPRDF